MCVRACTRVHNSVCVCVCVRARVCVCVCVCVLTRCYGSKHEMLKLQSCAVLKTNTSHARVCVCFVFFVWFVSAVVRFVFVLLSSPCFVFFTCVRVRACVFRRLKLWL